MPCPLEIVNVLGCHFDYHVFIELTHCVLLSYYKLHSLLISILVFCIYLCFSFSRGQATIQVWGYDEYLIYSFYLHVLFSF